MTPPALRSLSLQGYRCFTQETRLPLRPLTLLFGRNSAGKSAALRALALVERSIGEDSATAWNCTEAAGPGRGASFDRFCNLAGHKKQFTLGFGWDASAPSTVDRIAVRSFNDGDLPAVWQIVLANGDKFELEPDGGPWTLNGAPIEALRFSGLCPEGSSDPGLDAFAARLQTLRRQVQWLHGSRAPVPHLVAEGASSRVLDPSGENATQRLSGTRATPLLQAVGGFYAKMGYTLELAHPAAGQVSLRLRPRGSTYAVPLSDVGDGLGKVLPVLTAAHAADRGEGPGIVLVEDPEVHLHDDATRILAEHLAALAQGWEDGRALVLETHSRTLLLAVQLAVKQGVIAPEKVGILWAESEGSPTLTPVGLARSGAPMGSRLRASFRQDAELAAALAGLSGEAR
jgi:hypothetical protein